MTSLESSNLVLKSLRHSYILPVSALPEICPPEAKVTDVIRDLLSWAARVTELRQRGGGAADLTLF